jgi:hypothetical protein
MMRPGGSQRRSMSRLMRGLGEWERREGITNLIRPSLEKIISLRMGRRAKSERKSN